MKLIQTIGAARTMSALLVAFPGCEKQEGPMEQAGKKVAQGGGERRKADRKSR